MNYFDKLKEDSQKIDQGLRKIENTFSFLINGYVPNKKYNSRDIIDEKKSTTSKIKEELRKFLKEQNAFKEYVKKNSDEILEMERKIEEIRNNYGISKRPNDEDLDCELKNLSIGENDESGVNVLVDENSQESKELSENENETDSPLLLFNMKKSTEKGIAAQTPTFTKRPKSSTRLF